MSKAKQYAGQTSNSLAIFIQDTSSTTGGGLSGVTSASSGLVLEYRRYGQSSWTSVTPVSKTLGTYVSGGIVADGSLAGAYEVDFPDAAFAAGARLVWLRVRGVTNMLPVLMEIELDAVNYQTDAFGAVKPTVAGRTLDVSSTGEAGIDLSNVGSPTTTLNLSGTTISTSQAVASVTGNIGGNVVGSVGSISGVTFPSNFGSLGIDGSGVVLTVATVQELASGALAANGEIDTIGFAVWNELTSTVYTDGSFGDRVLISQNNTRALAVTGAGHIASVLHDAEPNSIPEDAFVSDAISARVIATDAETEIADAVLGRATSLANYDAGDVGYVLAQLSSMIESDGSGQWRYDTIALSMAAGAAGTDWTANERTAIRSILGIPASGTTPADPSVGILDTIRDGVNSIGINVYPVTSSTPERVNGSTITVYKDEQTNVTISTTATLTGLTLRFVAEDRTGSDVLVVENASFVARTSTSVTLQIPSSVTDEIANYAWTLRDVTTGNSVLARGVLSVQAAASKNA